MLIQEPLLGILYEDLTWEYVEVCSCATTNCPHNTNLGSANAGTPTTSYHSSLTLTHLVTNYDCLYKMFATRNRQ